jgi:exodeoxyribonuclease V alpha subunit
MLDGTPGTSFDGEVVIRRRRWASEETGFGVLDAAWEDDEIVLVGTIAHLEERERARVTGVWKEDRRYGLQVNVAVAEPLPPSGEAALIAYLLRVKHVGRVRAARLLERYGDDVLDAIDRDPVVAFRGAGLTSGA